MKTKMQIERELYAQRDIVASAQSDISKAKKRIEVLNSELASIPSVTVTTESIAAPIIELRGKPYDDVCADAIRSLTISTNGERMMTHYYGMKIYSGFGPQRHDGGYGYGPKHGSIVGSVGFTRRFISEKRLLTDAEAQACIEYIAAWRDSAKVAT